MGKEDIVMGRYLSENGRFADLFNGGLFGGKQEISAQDLFEASPVYMVKDGSGKWRKRTQDVRKYLKNGGALQVFTVENQSYVDYIMPLRCMEYATAEYRSQVEKIRTEKDQKEKNRKEKIGTEKAEKEKVEKEKAETEKILESAKESRKRQDPGEFLSGLSAEDRLAPVLTIVLYWGKEPWEGPRDLKDMMDFGGNEILEKKFCNYPMHLICMNEEKDCARYRTDLREMFEIMSLRHDRKALRRYIHESSRLSHMAKDARDLLAVVFGEGILKEKKIVEEEGKEGYDMKSLLEEMLEDEREEGREEGWKEGRKEGREEGRKEGREKGHAEGRMLLLVQLVCKKLVRSRTPQQISEDLEEDISSINQICEAAKEFAPGYEYEKVFQKLNASM